MKSRAPVLFAYLLVIALPLLGVSLASAAPGGNSANAKACQNGGWPNWVRADQSPLKNQGDCVSYAAHGGVLTSPKSAAQIACESVGGTFGTTSVVTAVSFSSVLWACNGWPWTDSADLFAKVSSLSAACSPLPNQFVLDADNPNNSTCGVVAL